MSNADNSIRCRPCGGSGRENWQEPDAPKIDCKSCKGKGWLPVQTEVCPVCRTAHDKPLCPIPADWCEHKIPRRFCTALHADET